MQSGRLLVNGSNFYCGNNVNSPCQLALKNQIPDISKYAKITDIPAALRGYYEYPLEMSKYIDFHEPGSSKDYDGRLYIKNGTLLFDNTSTVYQLASASELHNIADSFSSIDVKSIYNGVYSYEKEEYVYINNSTYITLPENTPSMDSLHIYYGEASNVSLTFTLPDGMVDTTTKTYLYVWPADCSTTDFITFESPQNSGVSSTKSWDGFSWLSTSSKPKFGVNVQYTGKRNVKFRVKFSCTLKIIQFGFIV